MFQGCFLILQVSVCLKIKIKMIRNDQNIGDPRNNNKCLLAGRSRFGFLHFYPEIFYSISSFSGPNVPIIGFRVDLLPPHPKTSALFKRGPPQPEPGWSSEVQVVSGSRCGSRLGGAQVGLAGLVERFTSIYFKAQIKKSGKVDI